MQIGGYLPWQLVRGEPRGLCGVAATKETDRLPTINQNSPKGCLDESLGRTESSSKAREKNRDGGVHLRRSKLVWSC